MLVLRVVFSEPVETVIIVRSFSALKNKKPQLFVKLLRKKIGYQYLHTHSINSIDAVLYRYFFASQGWAKFSAQIFGPQSKKCVRGQSEARNILLGNMKCDNALYVKKKKNFSHFPCRFRRVGHF